MSNTTIEEKITAYDRTEVLAAMYDLKEQGFKQITAKILADNTLALMCNSPRYGEDESPQINIDSINSWYEVDLNDPFLIPARVAGVTSFDYWWIFD